MYITTSKTVFNIGGCLGAISAGDVVCFSRCRNCDAPVHFNISEAFITKKCPFCGKKVVIVNTLRDQMDMGNYHDVTDVRDLGLYHYFQISILIALVSASKILKENLSDGLQYNDYLATEYGSCFRKRVNSVPVIRRCLNENMEKEIQEAVSAFKLTQYPSVQLIHDKVLLNRVSIEKIKEDQEVLYTNNLSLPVCVPLKVLETSFKEEIKELLNKGSFEETEYKSNFKKEIGDCLKIEKNIGTCGKCGIIVMKKEIKNDKCPNCKAPVCE